MWLRRLECALVALAAVTTLAACSSAAASKPAPGTSSLKASARVAGAPRPPAAAAVAITSLTGPIVALGDSYTAGDLMPLNLASRPPGCLRSSAGYAVRVASALHDSAGLVNASCTNAGVSAMTTSQRTYLGTNPPQLSAVAPDDALVMLTLGGDDLGFLNVLHACMKLSWTDPFGSPCERHYTSGGTDQLAARVTTEAARMGAVLAKIHAQARSARVVLIGYPDLFPQRGSCWPKVPLTAGDISYLRGIEVKLNAVLAAEAAATGTQFVDTYTGTIGHDFCADGNARDVEGLLPGSMAAPFHPNARGQAAMATLILAALAK